MKDYFLISMGLQTLLKLRGYFQQYPFCASKYEGLCATQLVRASHLAHGVASLYGGFVYRYGYFNTDEFEVINRSAFPHWKHFSGSKYYPIPNTIPSLMGNMFPHEDCFLNVRDIIRRVTVKTAYLDKYVALRMDLLDFLIGWYQDLLFEMTEGVFLCSAIF